MQLLGLKGRESNLQEAQIMAAYEHLASSPLEHGYSKQVGDGRIVLLHAAVDGCRNLRNIALRSDRQSIAMQDARQAMVQWWLMPAALSLLQEVKTFRCVSSSHTIEGHTVPTDLQLSVNVSCTLPVILAGK